MSRLKLIKHASKNKIRSKLAQNQSSMNLETPYIEKSVVKNRSKDNISSTMKPHSHKKDWSLPGTTVLDSNKRSKFSVSKTKNTKDPKTIAKHLENELSSNLQLSGKPSFESYKKTFKTIISHDRVFGKLLSQIKAFYDESIRQLNATDLAEANEALQREIKSLTNEIEEETREQEQVSKKIEKFSRENDELKHDLEDKESKYIEMQDQLLKISQLDISDLPLTQDNWEKLVKQSQSYSQACKDLKKQNKDFRQKEKKLLKLVLALKKRGVPVEEIYETEVRKKKQKSYFCSNEPLDSARDDDTENENLVDGPPLSVAKPQIVPALKISEQEYISSDESSYQSSLSSQPSEPGLKTH